MSEQKTVDSKIPTSFKERFSQEQWKQIKEKIYLLNSHNEEQTIPDIIHILEFLKELNASKGPDEFFGDPTIKNWFYNEFMAVTAKNFINTRTFNSKDVLKMVNQILEEMTLFWVSRLSEDNVKLAEMARVILDPTRAYYKTNDQEEITSSLLSSLMRDPSNTHLQWVASLKEGDLVDAVKIEQHHKKICWSRAKVVSVLENHIKISFLNDKETFNRYLDKVASANEIMPFGTKTQDYDWRMSIKVGDIIDVCDTSNIWYNSTVLDVSIQKTSEDTEIKQVFVGYRVYCENGDKVDAEGKKFSGWSSRYDEWLSVTNPRVQPRNRMAKKLYMASSSSSDDPQIEDSNDHVCSVNKENQKIYCITRQGHCRSVFLVSLLNKIGTMGVFDKLLERISDKTKWCPIDLTSNYVSILGNCHAVFHREFALEYIPKLKKAVWENVLKSPDSNTRNFTKEKIEGIYNAFDHLLKRVYSIPEKQEMIETFNLEIALMCFETDFLERKLQGIKALLDIIKQIKYGNAKFLTSTYLNGIIRKYEIFDKIYGKRGHLSMIQRSAEFLKHMINENAVEPDQLELIWSATQKGDKEAKLAVYKVFTDIALHFKAEHLDFIITKISEIPANEIISEEIELVYELSRYSMRPVSYMKKSCSFYWNSIIGAFSLQSGAIAEQVLNRFCDIMKGWEMRDQRFDVLLDCIANIEKDVSVLASIKIMKKLIDNYPASASASEQYTKATCIDHLIAEKGLLKALIHDLKEFKTNVKSKLQGKETPTEAELDKVTGDNNSYVTHISERLSFIHFVLSGSTAQVNLTFDLLKEIWETIINSAFIKAERDVLYKWLKDSTDSKAAFPMSIEDLIKFFKEKMTDIRESKFMTPEGFYCFRNFFLLINEKLGKISKPAPVTNTVTHYPSGYPQVNGTYYASYSYNHDDKKDGQNGTEFKVLAFPSELEGVQSLWEIILQTESEDVVEKAIEFLNKLYSSVGDELEGKKTELIHEFFGNCISRLNSIISNQKSYTEQALTSGCLRCLQLIQSIMDESEKKGVGSLMSHSALVKGELLTFTVTNDITSGGGVPKKIELRVYSNITVFELRVEIAKQAKTSWDQVKLLRYMSQKEIKDTENGKTIGDLRIKNGETLTAAKRPTPPIPQANLLMADGSLNPAARKIFVEWFEIFSENGKMSPDNCAAFINSCTSDGCSGEDKRVKGVFANHDSDRDGFMSQEDFVDFYYTACKNRPNVVWSNLASHHYRNDLKKPSEIEEEKIDIKNLPRYFLTMNQEYFKLIFSLLDYGGKIAIEAWKLLNRLPTSPELFKEIIELKGVRGEQSKNWDLILDSNSIYKLLYTLHVIEFLMEDENEKDPGEESILEILSSDDPKIQEYKKQWRADFIANGGFEHLFRIFNKFTKKETVLLSIFDKHILSFILKILKNYLTATFAFKVPGLYRNISFIRLFHLNLDFISDYLRTEGKSNEFIVEDGPKTIERKSSMSQESTVPAPADIKRKMSKDDSIKKKEAEEKKKEKIKIEETPDFIALVENLSGDLGQHILSTINSKELVKLCVTQAIDLLSKAIDFESEDRLILEYTLSILTAMLLYDNSLIEYLVNAENSPDNLQNGKEYILEGIFCTKSLNVRKYFASAFYILSRQTLHYKNGYLSKYIIKIFLQNLPDSQSENRRDCNQYFDLLCKLIEETYQSGGAKDDSEDKSLDFSFLIDSTINQLKAHYSTEKRSGTTINDKILIGFLNLCEKIIQVKPHLRDTAGDPQKHNLVHEIFASCLFDIADRETDFPHYCEGVDASKFSRDYVKCKGRDSRSIAYKLLGTLCRGHERNLNILLNDLLTLMSKIPIANNWAYSPSGDSKSFWGYVGIKNLGCICYMNSMLQQFYMTPAFRYTIMMADDKKELNLVPKDNGKYMVDDNVLHQLQKMFGFLELSDRQDYNPHEFCFSFKDFQGNPVNTSIQQDAQEFLNMIFDKLETGLKNTPFRHILNSVYGGKTCQQLICSNCHYVKSRDDTFYNLSLEVKNMKTIYDSLEKFITGEVIDDYFCDNCKKKVSTTKRVCVSQPPNVMIVHLQRITFDWEALVNIKVNSRLEFPHELNIEPYTQDGLEWREKLKEREKKSKNSGSPTKKEKPEAGEEDAKPKDNEKEDEEIKEIEQPENKEAPPVESEEPLGPYQKHPKEYYEYRLAGVVVHSGVAEAGHYYSFINTNRGDPSKRKEKDKWLEFNDSTIRDFDVKKIEAECFGGATTDSSDDVWGGKDKSRNAYILVYERVVKDPIKMAVYEENEAKFLETYLDLKNPENSKKFQVHDAEPNPEEKDSNPHKIYEVDYYGIRKFVPNSVYKKVWDDNHKFMFERHLYNEDFFKFIKEVCNAIKMPELNSENVHEFIFKGYKEIPEKSKQSYLTIIKILANLIYSLLAKASDNNQLHDICTTMKHLMSIVPESAYEFFDKVVLKDMKYTEDLITACPDRTVRYNVGQVILHAINVMVSFYGFDLSLKKFEGKGPEIEKATEKGPLQIEYSIVKLLERLLALMPVEMAKNWTKNGQYLEFWRDFAYAGTPQVRYLYQKQMISLLIDFFLEKKSPLGNEISEHKHTMGNKYASPEFDSLIQTIAILVRRSKVSNNTKGLPNTSLHHLEQFELSTNDSKCLDCPDFYEKVMTDKYDSSAFGTLVEHFAFENEGFSNQLAVLILKGLCKSNHEEARPFLEALTYFLNINDSLQPKRIEWILGFPQPLIHSIRNGQDSFGMYGNNAIDDLIYTYESPLPLESGSTSLLNLTLQNRRKLENLCLACLRQILILCEINPRVFEYFISLPAPSYQYAKFTDWIRPFLDSFIADAKRYYYAGSTKEELGNETLKLFNSLEEKLNQRIAYNQEIIASFRGKNQKLSKDTNGLEESKEGTENDSMMKKEESKQPNDAAPPILKDLTPIYIIGETKSQEKLNEIPLFIEGTQSVVVTEFQELVYITESLPTGSNNMAFPSSVVKDTFIRAQCIKPESALAHFIQPKTYGNAATHIPAAQHHPPRPNNNENLDKAHADHSEYQNPTKKIKVSNDVAEPKPAQPIAAGIDPAQQVNKGAANGQPIPVADMGKPIAPTQNNPVAPTQDNPAGPTQNNPVAPTLNNPQQGEESKQQSPVKNSKEETKEDADKTQSTEAPKVEEVELEGPTFVYELNPMVRRFVVANTTSAPYAVSMTLVPKSKEFLNFRIPCSTFQATLRPKSSANLLTLVKIFPEIDWAEYDVNYEIQKVDSAHSKGKEGGSAKKATFNIRKVENVIP